jgi:Fe2+ transport system protein B
MEVLKLTTKTDESGYLNIKIPTQLTAAEVNVVVFLNPVSAASKQKFKYDFSDLVGRLTWEGDAVTMQRNLRDEW